MANTLPIDKMNLSYDKEEYHFCPYRNGDYCELNKKIIDVKKICSKCNFNMK